MRISLRLSILYGQRDGTDGQTPHWGLAEYIRARLGDELRAEFSLKVDNRCWGVIAMKPSNNCKLHRAVALTGSCLARRTGPGQQQSPNSVGENSYPADESSMMSRPACSLPDVAYCCFLCTYPALHANSSKALQSQCEALKAVHENTDSLCLLPLCYDQP